MESRVAVFFRSLFISLSATIFATLIGIPVGIFLATREMRLRDLLVTTLNGLMGVPTVVRGLVLYLLFSRRGPLGFLHALYTPYIIITGETLLVFPIVASLTQSLIEKHKEARELIEIIGLSSSEKYSLLLREFRIPLLSIFLTAFSRAITELGIALIVGGNLEGYTRTVTTAIALYTRMGLIDEAIKLGLSLLALVFSSSAIARLLEARYDARG